MKLARLAILLCSAAAACAAAGGDVKGGDITDAGVQAATPGDFDAGAVFDPNAPCPGDGGDSWSSLYHDLFGPTGQPGSCSYQSSCHGTPGTQAQAQGITCMDEKGCRQSLIDRSQIFPSNVANPGAAQLLLTLRTWNPQKGQPRGIMPKEPSNYIFPDACVARIKAWIGKGFPAD